MNGLVIAATTSIASGALLISPAPADATTTTSSRTLQVEELPGSTDHLHDLAPGDRTEWAAQVTNQDTAPTAIRVFVRATGTDALISDPTRGLQLAIDTCPGRLSPTTTPSGAVMFDCTDIEERLGTGSAADLASDSDGLTGTSQIAPGETISVRIRLNLTSDAGNALENSQGQLHVNVIALGTDEGQGAPVLPEHGITGPPGTLGAFGINNPPNSFGTGTSASTGNFTGRATGPDLATTGQNIAAALTGALLTMTAGLVLMFAARRSRRSTADGEA